MSILGQVVKIDIFFWTNPCSTPGSSFFFILGDGESLSEKRIDCISRNGYPNTGTIVEQKMTRNDAKSGMVTKMQSI